MSCFIALKSSQLCIYFSFYFVWKKNDNKRILWLENKFLTFSDLLSYFCTLYYIYPVFIVVVPLQAYISSTACEFNFAYSSSSYIYKYYFAYTDDSRRSLKEKVAQLRQERLAAEANANNAQDSQFFQHQLSQLRRQMLMQTIEGLKRSLEDQSATLKTCLEPTSLLTDELPWSSPISWPISDLLWPCDHDWRIYDIAPLFARENARQTVSKSRVYCLWRIPDWSSRRASWILIKNVAFSPCAPNTELYWCDPSRAWLYRSQLNAECTC